MRHQVHRAVDFYGQHSSCGQHDTNASMINDQEFVPSKQLTFISVNNSRHEWGISDAFD